MKTICNVGPIRRSRRREEADLQRQDNPPPYVGGYGLQGAPPDVGGYQQRGVALVITLLMLVVITTMAIAFLLLSQRETASVSSLHSTTDAELAANAGMERARALIVAPFHDPITGTNEVMGPDFTVSLSNTNWPDPLAVDVGPPVLVNINRLSLNPPPPLDNRFFLDLNRNNNFEESGPNVDVTDDNYASTGQKAALIGDPMWVGMLQDAKKPHGRDNYYIARYSYLIQPIGRSLDMNWMHNEAVNRQTAGDIGYFRNQGIGPWELNGAAFLADLNANLWNTNFGPVSSTPYQYSTALNGQGSLGDAFTDARWLLTNRFTEGNKYYSLSVQRLFGTVGEYEFGSSGVDSFSNGPLLPWGTLITTNQYDNHPLVAGYDPIKPWPGADSPRHYFTPYELFDTAKFPPLGSGPNPPTDFRDRLNYASSRGNTQDRYTFYRMLSQLATDSAPEKDDRIDLNYINVGGVPATALISWTNLTASLSLELSRANLQFTNGFTDRYGTDGPEIFVNLVVERFLNEEGYPYTNRLYGRPFHIPVYTNVPGIAQGTAFFGGLPLYSSRINQMVQMAANILEATTAQKDASRDREYPYYPHVFRPVFEPIGGEIFISRYVLADKVVINDMVPGNPPYKWYDLNNSTNRPGNSQEWSSASFYDVPWIFGARKGIPNFNEFNVQSHVTFKRFLQFIKSAATGNPTQTNQAFIVGVKNYHFAEFANPSTNFYPRPLTAYMLNLMSVTLTNDSGFQWTTNWTTNNFTAAYPAYSWSNDYRLSITAEMPSLPESIIVLPGTLLPLNPLTFDPSQRPYTNNWWLTVTNRVRCFLFDQNRLVDAFTSAQMNMTLDINKVLDRDVDIAKARMWDTRLAQNGNISQGVQNQIDICLSNVNLSFLNDEVWKNYAGFNPAQFSSVNALITKFKAWIDPTNTTDLEEIAPFNPSRRVIQAGSWQVNDPAVHYTVYDLYHTAIPNIASNRLVVGETADPANNKVVTEANASLGRLNSAFYKPWGAGSTPENFVPVERDPMAINADSWQYPSQFAPAKYPNVGWLGRVHRGTPWQTIYLKADDPAYSSTLIGNPALNGWRAHLGASYMPSFDATNYLAGSTMFPTNDWRLFDLFTVAVHPNVTRGKLSINQTNLAAWSAVFSGIGATTAGNPNALGEFEPLEATAQPAGPELALGTNAPLYQLVERINAYRSNLTNTPPPLGRPVAQFSKLSDLLAVDFLTTRSPFLTPPYISPEAESSKQRPEFLLTDADYECIPQQIAGLVKVGEPRYVIYAWGQSLKPAGNVQGLGFGIDTSTKVPRNYQVTGEMATRAVVKIEYERDALGRPDRHRPRAVIESFNILPTD